MNIAWRTESLVPGGHIACFIQCEDWGAKNVSLPAARTV